MLTVGLFFNDLFDMEAPSASIDGLNFTFTTSKSASDDLDGITLANGDGSHFVLSLKFLVNMATHLYSFDVRSGSEMSLTAFSALGGDTYTEKHKIRLRYHLLV